MSEETENYICFDCGGSLEFSHEDDVQQRWWGCMKCGELTTKPQKKVVPAPRTTTKKPENTCGECARFRVPDSGCPWPSDILASHAACSEFYSRATKTEGRKRESQADKLIKLCLGHNPTLFQDQYKTAYVKLQKGDGGSTLRLRSRLFKSYLASLLWESEEKAPGSEALASAVNVLESKAIFEGPRHILYNRVAPAEDGFWIDMTDDKWRAIRVTCEGWKIVDDPPILFRRYSHQLPMVEPSHGGNPWRFLDFINVDKTDKNTRLTLLTTIHTYFIPLIPHPIICPYGIQGSGKTFLLTLIRRLIDPSAVDTLTLPRSERERIQQLDHNWCSFYDNITYLQPWMSDTICRAVTGSGFMKRELYTNDEDVTCSFKRCISLSGINIAAQRGDLLDRVLLVKLLHIPKAKRRKEEELLAEFANCKAEILGGILDTLVKAIQIYPTVQLKELFRMADFTHWGCAITIALGKTKEDFITAYGEKVRTQIQEAAFADPLAMVLMDWIQTILRLANNSPWKGTPTELFTLLTTHAKDEMKISTRQKTWPKAPHILVRRLNELAPSLRSLGLNVLTGIREGKEGTRRIILESVSSVSSDINVNVNGSKADGTDATDTTLLSSPSKDLVMNNIKSWCLTNRNERSEISLHTLAKFIEQELKQNSQRVIQVAFNQAILMPSSKIGMAVVV